MVSIVSNDRPEEQRVGWTISSAEFNSRKEMSVHTAEKSVFEGRRGGLEKAYAGPRLPNHIVSHCDDQDRDRI
jgi:hypothetical protein